MKRHLATAGRFNGEYLTVDAAPGGLLGLVSGKRPQALQIDSLTGSLFQSDWEDISIRVFQPEFFDSARSLGEEYEELTQQTVTLLCYFELDLGETE
jgi:hypothetical protein